MNIVKRKNSKGDKAYFTIEYGRGNGERQATGIFIYTHPKSQVEKNHNKEALTLIATRKSELLLERQAIGSGFIPAHKFKGNFLDYYEQFVKDNQRKGQRLPTTSLSLKRLSGRPPKTITGGIAPWQTSIPKPTLPRRSRKISK
jgi:hypothetical protein